MKYSKLAYRFFEQNEAQAGLVLNACHGILIDSATEETADKANKEWEKWLGQCTDVSAHNKWIDKAFKFLTNNSK